MIDIIFSRLNGEWKTSYLAEKLFKGKKVLDVGSGLGDFLKFDPKNFVGIDINDEVLEICKKRGLHAKKASVKQMPFPDEHFDGINCQQVIEHLTPEDAFKMMQEMTRVLKKGGRIAISTEMVTKRFWNTFSHIRPYPPGAIRKLLRPSGQETFEKMENLSIERIYYSGIPFKIGILSIIATLLAHYLGIGRINYTMILRKI
jgi:ubiquinone/menaquinone biosynthesis C-methylase UbiE